MDKQDVVYIYTVEYYSVIKKEWNLVICNNMDELGGDYAKWNKSERATNTVWYHLYVASKKYNKLVNKIKKKETHRYREQTSGYQWGEGRGRGNIGVRNGKVQTIRYKITYKDILYNTGNTANIL